MLPQPDDGFACPANDMQIISMHRHHHASGIRWPVTCMFSLIVSSVPWRQWSQAHKGRLPTRHPPDTCTAYRDSSFCNISQLSQ